MIKYELFSINCIASNINWQAKTVSISHNIKYFMVSIEHYGFNDKLNYELNNELNNESTLNLPITYSDVSRYWFENINKYNLMNGAPVPSIPGLATATTAIASSVIKKKSKSKK